MADLWKLYQFVKGNRGALLKGFKLQTEALKVCYSQLEAINNHSAPANLNNFYNITFNDNDDWLMNNAELSMQDYLGQITIGAPVIDIGMNEIETIP